MTSHHKKQTRKDTNLFASVPVKSMVIVALLSWAGEAGYVLTVLGTK
jgi:hypothetical protein